MREIERLLIVHVKSSLTFIYMTFEFDRVSVSIYECVSACACICLYVRRNYLRTVFVV